MVQQKVSETELIDRSLDGDQAAYAALVKLHERFVFTLALRFARNREDAEEIAQDTFVKAFRALNAFQRQSKFSTWLYRITYTTAMTFLRRKRPEATSLDEDQDLLSIEDPAGNNNLSENRSRSHQLNEAIGQLSGADAAVITLFYLEEQSLEEIGQALDLEPNTVKVRLFRARQRLKEKLEKSLDKEIEELI